MLVNQSRPGRRNGRDDLLENMGKIVNAKQFRRMMFVVNQRNDC